VGRPAIARNDVGEGSVTYCGVWPDADLAASLVGDLLARADVATTARLPRGVRVNRRGDVTWVSNFTSDVFRVTSDGDPLDESAFLVGDAELGGFDAVVVTVPPESLAVTPES
jgi:beta-galactosidase